MASEIFALAVMAGFTDSLDGHGLTRTVMGRSVFGGALVDLVFQARSGAGVMINGSDPCEGGFR